MDLLGSVKGRNEGSLTPRLLDLCDKLVEYLHIEVMGAEVKSDPVPSLSADDIPRKEPINAGQKECPVCGNVITESNKSLICMKCMSRFCSTCEGWFREERKRGEKPLCEKCFSDEELKKHYDKGQLAFESRDWDAAISAFEQVVNIDERYQDAAKRLSLAIDEKQK